MKLALIPQPKELEPGRGSFRIPRKRVVGLSDWRLEEVADALAPVFRTQQLRVAIPGQEYALVLKFADGLKPGGYTLDISPGCVVIEADSVEAAHCAGRTLRQVAAQSPKGALPCLHINDWPDFSRRGIYYDATRGRVPKRERLIEQAELLAQYKINEFQVYLEHTFKFQAHPDIGKGASPLTADDIVDLDQRCAELHIDLVPSLATFGHMANILKHPQYRGLSEDWGEGKYLDPEYEKVPGVLRRRAWALSPANPDIYPFLDSLFAELLPLFRSEYFNVCCDETWDLGLGQSYELCKKKGKGRVYLDHIKRLRDLAAKYGKRIQFWGDIIRQHPELIDEIPKDVTVLDWGYGHKHPFEAIRDFRLSGLEFYACPGTSSWCSMFPRLHEATANIAGFAAAAKKNGGRGLLTTDWGDGGHYNFTEYSWHGYLFGAEQAWNTDADPQNFTRRFCMLFLQADSKELPDAVDALGDVSQLGVAGYYQSVWQHIFFACPGEAVLSAEAEGIRAQNGELIPGKVRIDAALGEKTLPKLDAIRKVLAGCAQQRNTDPAGVLPYWLFAVDSLTHAARKLTVLSPGGSDTQAGRTKLKKELKSLMERFEKLWLARNHPSEIRTTKQRYRRVLKAL